MKLNVTKSSIIVFPLDVPVNISLQYYQERIPEVDCIKYLGVLYDEKLSWRNHIEHIKIKATRAVGMISRFGRLRSGPRRDMLIMIYRTYVRPILEFGCVLYSGGAAYNLEREALRNCLGVPKFTANNVLYQEARIPTLACRFHILTVETYLKIYESTLRRQQFVFLAEPSVFFFFFQ